MTRWIVIGSAKRLDYIRIQNAGYPCDGFWLNWRGRRDWCQPHQFLNWAQMEEAIHTRLGLAGLRLVNLAVDWAGEFKPVRVEVARRGRKQRPRAGKTEYEYAQ